ncbi:MAG TPA: N-acetylmuramoyl-L-alanine amidase [Candidatus Kapabacteria bacterium]|nr:N-acetylmuramoyl-L-alanine amidase [Candidatus Kapabacteria bacterium]
MVSRKHISYILGMVIAIAAISSLVVRGYGQTSSISQGEEGFENEEEQVEPYIHPRLRGLDTWVRPPGPLRVALQAGHWKAVEAPEEQINLRKNTGASGGGTTEWEVNLSIAEEAKRLLEPYGILVDVLPTTIPPNYWADVFIAIHADGNTNTGVSGYKVAAPRRDVSGRAEEFAEILSNAYEEHTKLVWDPNISRNMRGYYAFNWRKYDHSLHPKTVAVILETGFLTNPHDRKVIVNHPEKSAAGIAEAVLTFFQVSMATST